MHGFFSSQYLVSMETQKYVKNCDFENKLDNIDCFKDFVAEKMGCSIPWDHHLNNSNPICKTSEELEKYLNLRFEIFQKKHQDELEGRGCISKSLKNCQKIFWPQQESGKMDESLAGTAKAMFQLDMDVNDKDIIFLMFSPMKSVSTDK